MDFWCQFLNRKLPLTRSSPEFKPTALSDTLDFWAGFTATFPPNTQNDENVVY